MSTAISRLHLTTILIAAAGIWGTLLILDGIGASFAWFKHLSLVVGAMLLLIAAFEHRLWRFSWLQGWFVKKPYIGGTWQVRLRSDWRNPATGCGVDPIDGYLAIRQTYTGLSLRLMTKESTSEVLTADLVRAADGTFRAASVYRNDPGLDVRERSPIHYGALILDIQLDDAITLSGQYWTDRATRGDIASTGRRHQIFSNFGVARKAFAPAGKQPEQTIGVAAPG